MTSGLSTLPRFLRSPKHLSKIGSGRNIKKLCCRQYYPSTARSCDTLPPLNLHSFYPVNSILKPINGTIDDIVIHQNTSSCPPSDTHVNQSVNHDNDPSYARDESHLMRETNTKLELVDAVRELRSQICILESLLLMATAGGAPDRRPSHDQLQRLCDVLSDDLPKLFEKSMNYSIFHQDLVFENNLRGTKSRGLKWYIAQMQAVRAVSVCRFGSVRLELLQMQSRPGDGSIRIRWRIRGVPLIRAMLASIRLAEATETWYDGISTYHVNNDGLVYKHVIDEIIPDDENKAVSARSSLLARLARALPLSPPAPSPAHFSSLVAAKG